MRHGLEADATSAEQAEESGQAGHSGQDENAGVDRVRGETCFRTHTRAAFKEFLTLPIICASASVLLAGVAIVHDRRTVPWGRFLQERVAEVVPPQAASTFLSTVTPGLLTVVSIIFFVALMAVQHQSGKYSPVVLDQFMRRDINQVFFGLFIGLTVYSLLCLGLVPQGQAVVSGALGLLLTGVTIMLLLVFIYSTIDQMRPSSAAWVLQNMALQARAKQEPLLARCRSHPRLDDTPATLVLVRQVGYVVHIDGRALASALQRESDETGEVEVELLVTMGDHLVPGGSLAKVRGGSIKQRHRVAAAVLAAFTLGRKRDADRDATHTVNQLSSMAWSATASSGDLEGARVAVESLHGVLTLFDSPDVHDTPETHGGELPLVYRDPIADKVIDGLTNVVAASAVSRQHQSCADSLTTLSRVLPQLTEDNQRVVIAKFERVLPTVTEHLFTMELENAFELLGQAMHQVGEARSAQRLRQIQADLNHKNRLDSPD